MNENDLIIQRLNDLCSRAYERGYSTYSCFLNINEISLLKEQRYPTDYKLFGGYDDAERCIVCFNPQENSSFPIVCLRISPLQQRFSDALNHRDFLGALMNLGIERSTIGDIIIKDNVGYAFCLESIAEYICENIDRIRHTSVKCELITDIPDFLTALPDEDEIIVSSLRADAVTAGVFNLSRNTVSRLFNQQKIFINSRAIIKEGTQLKEDDIVSVRGYGKFIYSCVSSTTRKGRYVIKVRIYK